MKYHVTIEVAGVKVRMKNVEASNQDDAEQLALKKAKQSIKVVGSTIALEEGSNAKPMGGEEMFEKFFGKSRQG